MAIEVESLTQNIQVLGEEADATSQNLQAISERFEELSAEGKRFASGFERDLSGAMRSLVVNGENLGDVLKGLAVSVADRGLQSALAPALGMVSQAVATSIPFANGGVISNQRVRAFANGGVVDSPTYFPMNTGLGLMGEAGPEAIMPLQRDAQGRLGVSSQAAQNININMKVETPDVAGFHKSKAQIRNQIQRAMSRNGR